MVVNVILASYELEDLFVAFDIRRKLERSQLVEREEAPAIPARADWCRGGVSYFTRVRNTANYEVGRVHYLVCPDGSTTRWPSVLVLGEARLRRVGHQQRPD